MGLSTVALEKRVERLDDEVARIFAVLSTLQPAALRTDLYVTQATIEAGVEQELKAIALRHQTFPKAAQDQVAWSMLLVAYQHAAQRRKLSASALCGLSYAPYTTALRWLGELEQVGLIDSEPDENDRRRRWVTISAQGRGLMVRYFTKLRE